MPKASSKQKQDLPLTEHKCDTCAKDFPTCGVNNIVWGIDLDPKAMRCLCSLDNR
jgi:hypothetical protein